MFEADPHPFLVPADGAFHITDHATAPSEATLKEKDWKDHLEKEKSEMGHLQHKLFADQRFAMLLVFQALDAAGKDSTIRHVFTGINPTGVRVFSFKRPSEVEVTHDFLWRTTAKLPRRGYIGIFNRSYYEEVLVVRVHPQFLAAQKLSDGPTEIPSEDFWAQRYRSIVEHERHLAQSGTVILKFWLNVSKEEQRRRLLARIDRPNKRWKFALGDLAEREHWDEYQRAFEAALRATSRSWAPWYAIPADDKIYMQSSVAEIVNNALKKLNIDFPKVSPETEAELEQARTLLT